jgi:hypothetical protein
MPYFGTVKTDDEMHHMLSGSCDKLYDQIYDALREWQSNKAEACSEREWQRFKDGYLHDSPDDY